ncbi:riboflavin biosynthesis protein RibD [Peptoniphilus sp. oral taxon 375 str. F0436]|uniref:bifunctional diaminohydroxyphosphoribosylaminopyrimidine deaminase/5-amino-6-(5-phosphoribosylamino)uracil reductase RibD n=1 Tax=Urinicoccus timonensis TaxID=2024205 RepID=UPI00021A374B|nr:bifunctional diaminohydroxyphosphoribosylaminopyrimidine deaminase/5-amino-6-(5-phosphoribosylamino)uracil reductase RibD [Urinicoccus timonensis]EGS30534.1 riboflavin biosynthesis protein RibD [Peptoniphilus sp. oral taxon 375 str. F0436]
MDQHKMDQEFMKEAIQEALKGQGQTLTNPLVGAVLVRDGKIISRGYHEKFGSSHAEVNCLRDMDAQGATLYVTLEPCSHYGKTPPCVDLVIEKKVKRVVVGELDSNPQVRGRGIQKLKEAGIQVTCGVLEEECHAMNRLFHFTIRQQRPYVILKMAQSLDGKIATKTGDSQWITGEEARRDGHRLRGICDAILVGRGTALQDNPQLTCRTGGKTPLRVVLDRTLKTPRTYQLFQGEKTIFYVGPDQETRALTPTAQAISIGQGQDGLVLEECLEDLYKNQQVSSLLVEGGSQVLSSFIKQGLVDQWVIYQAPLFIGGDGKSTIASLGVEKLSQALESQIYKVDRLGKDLRIQGGKDCLLEL